MFLKGNKIKFSQFFFSKTNVKTSKDHRSYIICHFFIFIIHSEQGHKENQPGAPPVGEKIFKDDELTNLIDPILNMDDHNRDGYIDYPEFIRAQQKNMNKEGN